MSHTWPDSGQAAQRRRKMRAIARFAGWAALFGMVAVIAYEVYLASDPAVLRASFTEVLPQPTATTSDGAIIIAWAIGLVPAAIFVAAMWKVRQLFGLLAGQHLFHPAIPGLLRTLGYLAIGAAFAGIVARTLTVLVLTFDNPPGQRLLSLGISSGDFTSAVVGLLLLAFALLMQEALLIEEDNRSIL